MPQIVISANNITVRLKTSLLFANTSWQLCEGEQWLIVGPNGAGKTTFAKALAGLVPLKFGEIWTAFSKSKIKYVSFETEQQFLQKEELQKEFASYVGREKKGKTVRQFLGKKATSDKFGITPLLSQEIATLSTGESRKVFLAKVIASHPKLLILDEPFNGLDKDSRDDLETFLNDLAKTTHIILIAHNLTTIPKFITNVMEIEDGKIKSSSQTSYLSFPRRRESRSLKNASFIDWIPDQVGDDKETIIQMKNVSVFYGKKTVLSNINWIVRKGENWAIVGPNGAGKSTLVKLITGDSLQVHANDIRIFGKQRDELSLWELREHIAYVSPETHMQVRGLETLSQGQKRLVLIERALAKSPELLILDEPCHHLDHTNRKQVLEKIDQIARSGKTTLLLITHHEEEIVPSINRILRLRNGKIVIQ